MKGFRAPRYVYMNASERRLITKKQTERALVKHGTKWARRAFMVSHNIYLVSVGPSSISKNDTLKIYRSITGEGR